MSAPAADRWPSPETCRGGARHLSPLPGRVAGSSPSAHLRCRCDLAFRLGLRFAAAHLPVPPPAKGQEIIPRDVPRRSTTPPTPTGARGRKQPFGSPPLPLRPGLSARSSLRCGSPASAARGKKHARHPPRTCRKGRGTSHPYWGVCLSMPCASLRSRPGRFQPV